MAFHDDNSIASEGISFRVGSWIFITNGSGGFESLPVDRNIPKIYEAAKLPELDDFVDQFEEVGFSDETRIQPKFNVIETKTLSELEEDLGKLLEDSKQETSTNGKTILPNYIRIAELSLRKKMSMTSFKKTTRKKK